MGFHGGPQGLNALIVEILTMKNPAFFDVEVIDGVKVYFCMECGHYIKAVDTKDKISPDAETMDALTLDFDELAKEEGFTQVP